MTQAENSCKTEPLKNRPQRVIYCDRFIAPQTKTQIVILYLEFVKLLMGMYRTQDCMQEKTM